ncbi:MAG: hypothetical protein IPN85_18165 [Flavobacteriales bacterium]|nr:hypothetical protein [Flavobacteriales bacterium]
MHLARQGQQILLGDAFGVQLDRAALLEHAAFLIHGIHAGVGWYGDPRAIAVNGAGHGEAEVVRASAELSALLSALVLMRFVRGERAAAGLHEEGPVHEHALAVLGLAQVLLQIGPAAFDLHLANVSVGRHGEQVALPRVQQCVGRDPLMAQACGVQAHMPGDISGGEHGAKLQHDGGGHAMV